MGVALIFNWCIEGEVEHSSTGLLSSRVPNLWFQEPNLIIVELGSSNLYPPILTQFLVVFFDFNCVEVALVVGFYCVVIGSTHSPVEKIEEVLSTFSLVIACPICGRLCWIPHQLSFRLLH